MGGPWAVLAATIILWAVVWKGLLAIGAYDSANVMALARLMNVIIGFVSILSILMVPVGLIVGIVILVRKP
jgi:hypothetical protein